MAVRVWYAHVVCQQHTAAGGVPAVTLSTVDQLLQAELALPNLARCSRSCRLLKFCFRASCGFLSGQFCTGQLLLGACAKQRLTCTCMGRPVWLMQLRRIGPKQSFQALLRHLDSGQVTPRFEQGPDPTQTPTLDGAWPLLGQLRGFTWCWWSVAP